MGTNYYAVKAERVPLHPDKRIGEDVGVHLTKTSKGWTPSLQKHDRCMCGCIDSPYTNWEEFKSYVKRDDIVIIDIYGRYWDADDFLDKLKRFRDNGSQSMAGVAPDAKMTNSGFAMLSGVWE